MSETVDEHPFPRFDVRLSSNYGYVGNWEAAKALKEFFELRKALRFPALRTSTTFGRTDILKGKKKKYHWAEGTYVGGEAIPYDGIPFIILDKNIYECVHGVDHKLKRKAKRATLKVTDKNNGEPGEDKKQQHDGDKNKKNCPAKIRMKEVMKFPDFKIPVDSRYRRNQVAGMLDEAIAKGAVRVERRIYIYFPSDAEHTGHVIRGQECATRQHVAKPVIALIDQLVEEGLNSTDSEEIGWEIAHFIEEALGNREEEIMRSRGPGDKDLNYHIQAAEVIHRYSGLNCDEELEGYVAAALDQSPDQNTFFRKQAPEGKRMLLVQQTLQQQHKLADCLEGGKFFLDTTCKTTQESLPLMLVSLEVKGHQEVVGSAIVEEKSPALLREALEVMQSWNPGWRPGSWTCEKEEEDITALEDTFKGVPILLCEYHRMSAWLQWVQNPSHGVGDSLCLLEILEALSNTRSKAEYCQELARLKASCVWRNNPKLQAWFNLHWLPHYTRWVLAFLPSSQPQPPPRPTPTPQLTPTPETDCDTASEPESCPSLTNTVRNSCIEALHRLTELTQQASDQESLDRLLHCLAQAEQRYRKGCTQGGREGGRDRGREGGRDGCTQGGIEGDTQGFSPNAVEHREDGADEKPDHEGPRIETSQMQEKDDAIVMETSQMQGKGDAIVIETSQMQGKGDAIVIETSQMQGKDDAIVMETIPQAAERGDGENMGQECKRLRIEAVVMETIAETEDVHDCKRQRIETNHMPENCEIVVMETVVMNAVPVANDVREDGKRQEIETNQMPENCDTVVMETVVEAGEVLIPVEMVEGDVGETNDNSEPGPARDT